MERHHFAQTVAILNSGSCNIFATLPDNQFKEALDMLQCNILATDLAHHFKIMAKLKDMACNGYQVDNEKHHELLLCLIMTSCDLSDQTKDWNNLIEVAVRTTCSLWHFNLLNQGLLHTILKSFPLTPPA